MKIEIIPKLANFFQNDSTSLINQSRKKAKWNNKKITLLDIAIFFRQLSTLINSGIPIVKCCSILSQCQNKIKLNKIIKNIKNELESGKNLTQTLLLYPQYFDLFTCDLIRLGEHTGTLDSILTKIADHKEKTINLKNKIVQSLFYPVLIFIVAMIIFLIMLLFVIPHFAELFHELHGPLPLITLIIFSCSAFLKQYIWFLLFGFSILCYLFYYSRKFFKLNHFLNYLPFIKNIKQKMLLTEFIHNLIIALSSGLPLAEGLKILANITPLPLKPAIVELQNRIINGQELYVALQNGGGFPTLMIQLVKIGEESGNLEPMLAKIAEFYEADMEHFFQCLHQLLEPLIMIVLGVLISGLVIAMYLPIFKLGTTI